MARIAWFGCWIAYWLVLILPTGWRIWWALLPHAGSYAHLSYAEFEAIHNGDEAALSKARGDQQ